MESLYDEELIELIVKNNKTHTTGKAKDIIPYTANTASKLSGNFNLTLGSYARFLTNVKIDKKQIESLESLESYSDEFNDLSIFTTLTFKQFESKDASEDMKNSLMKIIDSFLFVDHNLSPVHPFLFNFINYDKSEYDRFGKFLADVLGSETILESRFNDREADHILIKLIIQQLSALLKSKPESKKENNEFQNMLPFLSELYKQDIEFLQKDSERFNSDFGLLTHFYSFMYLSQLVFKFDQFENADYSKADEFYFVLDWEKVSERRLAITSSHSFKTINDRAKNFFAHSHALAHLSHNSLQANKDERYKIYNYQELHSLVSEKGEEFERDFINKLNSWLTAYSSWQGNESLSEQLPDQLSEQFRLLKQMLVSNMANTVQSKTEAGLRNIGKGSFLKSRGRYGNVLNLKHDLLILLTSVIVKEERMLLKEVIQELGKRGICFDQNSKRELIEMYKLHNMLDKKSDSGDAQYVKRIL